jgi:hypothetical protein
MAQIYRIFLILFLAYYNVLAETCRFYPDSHLKFPKDPDSFEPQLLARHREDVNTKLKKIHLFSIENLSAEDCKKAKLIMETYGEAVMNASFPLNIEEYERYKVIRLVTELAFRKMQNPALVCPSIVDSSSIMDQFYSYYKGVACLGNSFMMVYKEESDEILKIIQTNDKAQEIINLIEGCIINDFDEPGKEATIKTLLKSEEQANKLISIKNTLKQNHLARTLNYSKIQDHYIDVLKSALDELKISVSLSRDFSFDLVYYLIFQKLGGFKADESFDMIFADHPKAASFRDKVDLPAILNSCKEYFHSEANYRAPASLKDNEKLFKALEKLAIPLVNQKVSLLSKLPPKPVPSNKQNNQISDSDPTPPSNVDKRTIFLYSLPIWILLIGGIIFFIVRRKRQKGGN